MLTVVQAKIPSEVIAYVEKYRHLLTPDVSQYANERLRCWMGAEAPLSEKFSFSEVPEPFGYKSRIWNWLERFCKHHLNFNPEVALIHVGGADCSDPEDSPMDGHGGTCGIRRHRDASYADFWAVGINLRGEATFGYQCFYPDQDKWSSAERQNKNAVIEHIRMSAGTCVAFNCKNPHFAQVGPNRWCINAWRISDKRRAEFNEFRNNFTRFSTSPETTDSCPSR